MNAENHFHFRNNNFNIFTSLGIYGTTEIDPNC